MNACADLAAGAAGGVAPALAAVDCLASQMASSAFSRLFGSEGALLPALTILLTLYIAVFAFALITGRSRLGVAVLTPRMMTLGLVLTFATSWMAWQQVVWNLAVGAPDQIAGVLMGAQDAGNGGSATQLFAQRIDMVVGAIAEAASSGGQQDGGVAAQQAANGGAFSPQGLMWLGAMLLLLGTVGVLVTSRIALAVLLATGPVFVVLALFPRTRGLTAGWLRALVLTGLTPLFVTLAGSLMLELAVPVVASLRGLEGGVDARAAMALFLIASVHCALMAMMLKVAGTMAAAWNVFGLAAPEEGPRVIVVPGAGGETAGHGGSAAPALVPAASRMLVAPGAAAAGLAAETSGPAAASAAATQRTHITHVGAAPAPGLSARPGARARGIGSRFAPVRPEPTKPGPTKLGPANPALANPDTVRPVSSREMIR